MKLAENLSKVGENLREVRFGHASECRGKRTFTAGCGAVKKTAILLLTGLLCHGTLSAGLIFQETFNHPAGEPLIGTTPDFGGSMWATNGTSTSGIKTNVIAGSLAAPVGFVASTGNSVMYGRDTALTGKEIHTQFAATTAGSVIYYSFLVNIDAVAAGKGAGIISLSFDSGAEYAQLFATNTTGNSYETLGLGGKSTASGVWSTNQFATGTTHLIVISYENIAGSGNDIMKMWIDPTSFGGAAPAYDLTLTGFSETSSGLLNTLELKNSTTIPRTIIDEIRIGTTWADVTPSGAGACKLVFTNLAPAQFVQKPLVTTDLPFGIRNDSFDATNVTVSLTANYPWLTVNAGTNSIALIGFGNVVTSLFNVAIASNAPVGIYSNAFTLNMQGYGTDGSTSNSSAQVDLEILNTVFCSMSKTSFAADTNGIDTATLTVSNEAAFALSFSLTNSLSGSWLTYPAGALTVPANGSTSITITANGSLTAGQGQYSGSLSVTYLNNTSIPNPTNFSLLFDVGPKIEPLIASAVIAETGGVNLLPGQYEQGEILDITITSTNNGAITVANIAHTLSANPSWFTIVAISNAANYASMTVGSVTTTTYQVTIAANTPLGSYTFSSTNSASGTVWANTRSLSVVNFGSVAKIEPLIASAVIAEAGGVNQVPGQYEPGEILNITITSTNNGAVTVSNIVNTLSANPAYFTITTNNAADYALMAVGVATTTTYQVTIAANTPLGAYTFSATNSANGASWTNSRSLTIVNFGSVAKIEPLLASAVITEAGGVNWAAGQYEPGEILNITVTSTNNGAMTVTNILNTLSANPAYFTITTNNAADYASMAVGAVTSTTYQVTISATTPDGAYLFSATNSASGASWTNTRSLNVLKAAIPTSLIVPSSSGNDGRVGSDGTITKSLIYVGDTSGTLQSGVVMFKLPLLPPGYRVVSANLSMLQYQSAGSAYAFKVDLYALRRNALPDILATDYYSGSYAAGAGRTPIETGWVPTGSGPGLYSITNATPKTDMGNWVQAQYDAGATTNEHIFFGLAPNGSPVANQTYRFRAGTDPTDPPKLTLILQDFSKGPCNLVFTNVAPAQFVQKPFVVTNLPFGIRNDNYDATNVTVSLAANYSWLMVNSGTVTNSQLKGARPIGPAETITNFFGVTIASNAPVGVFANAFTLTMRGTGLDGTNTTFTSPVSLQIASTVFSSISKTSLASATNGTDTATLTVSNQAAFDLSFVLSHSPSAAWLSYPAGTLTLPANSVTNITVTADGNLTPGNGKYSTSLSVTYLNNTSIPNPTNFPIVFDVGPKIEPLLASALITEFGGTNWLSGEYEPGEILDITITSTNNGAVTVSNIVHKLWAASSSYFSITPVSNTASYASMAVGDSTTSTYRVTIAANATNGVYTFFATNSAVGSSWANTRNLSVVSQARPAVSPASITMTVLEGTVVTNTQVTVTNSGNAAFTFNITDNGLWDYSYTAVQGNNGSWVSASTVIPLTDPETNNPYISSTNHGVSAATAVGFNFPFYGITYSNFYVTADGYIGLTNPTNVPGQSVDRLALPSVIEPLIAPFWGALKSPDGSIRYKKQSGSLVVSYTNVSLNITGGGTNLQFQAELFTDGRIEFRYKSINGSMVSYGQTNVTAGIQGNTNSYTGRSVTNIASGKSMMFTPQKQPWISYSPGQNVPVGPRGSQTITFTADGSMKPAGTGTNFIAQFNWSSGGSNGVSVSVTNTALAPPVYSAVSTLSFAGEAGQVTSVPFVISNAGAGPLTFSIVNPAYTNLGVISAVFDWIDISTNGTEVSFADPDASNPYLRAEDEGLSSALPMKFVFPLYSGNFTQMVIGVNGAIRFDLENPMVLSGVNLNNITNLIQAPNNLALANYPTHIPYRMIAPYFGDLVIDANASVKYLSTAERMVVTWSNVKQYGMNGGSNLTFQAILEPNGDITFQYKFLSGRRWPYTQAGIRYVEGYTTNLTGVYGARFLPQAGDFTVTTNGYGYPATNYVDSISNRVIKLVTKDVQVIRFAPASGSIAGGGIATIMIDGDASQLAFGANSAVTNAHLVITHNASTNPAILDVTFTATNSSSTVFLRASAEDSDGDGLADTAERIAGTDPQDAGSVFTPTIEKTSAGTALSWPAPLDGVQRNYTIYFTTNLMSLWEFLYTVTNGTSYLDAEHSSVPVIYYKTTVQ